METHAIQSILKRLFCVALIIALSQWTLAAGESSPLDTQLLEAASQGDSALVAELVTRGAHINAQDKDGVSALMKASVNRNVDAVKTLLGKGADVDARDRYGRTALIYASINANAGMVRCLLDKVTDIDMADHFNVTALMYAINKTTECTVPKLLLEKGANPNKKTDVGRTALMMAVSAQKLEEVEMLLDAGADVNASDHHGWTALMEASGCYPQPEVKWYISYWNRLTDLVWPVRPDEQPPDCYIRSAHIVKVLLKYGADVHAKDKHGVTALQVAAKSRNKKIEKLLRAYGAKE